jgi:hypothetical protein
MSFAEQPDYDDEDLGGEHVEEKIRLSRDLVNASRTMGSAEARYLVDLYYLTQEMRKRSDNQVRSLEGSLEPHVLLDFFADKNFTMEKQIAKALDHYTQTHMMGDWLRNITGIGPVIAAGLLAHIYIGMWCAVCHGKDERDCARRQEDKKRKLQPHLFQPIESCPTVGHIWQFGGIAGDGQKPWEKGKRRPFNAEFKTLLWKAGISFMRFHNKPECYYGKLYQDRKFYEIGRNESGALAEQAARQLPHFRKETESYKWYVQGKLPPAHIDARARRYAVKMMLAHLHGEWWTRTHDGNPPPLPYPVAFLGHAHVVPPPPMPPAAGGTTNGRGTNGRRAK